MSGLEAIGAVASVAQLVNYIIGTNSSIFELRRKLQEAPTRLKRQTATLEEVIKIAQLLKENEFVQNDMIATTLNHIITKVDQTQDMLPQIDINLSSMSKRLTKKWKTFKHMRNEDRLLEILAELRDHKISLVLCIANIQVKQSGEASHNSSRLLDFIPKMNLMELDISRMRLCLESRSMVSNPSVASNTLKAATPSYDSTLRRSTSYLNHDDRHRRQGSQTQKGSQGLHAGNTYDGALARGQAYQINGNMGDGGARPEGHRYNNCTSEARSFQVNGDIASNDLRYMFQYIRRG